MTCKHCGHPHTLHTEAKDQKLGCAGNWFNEATGTMTKPCACDDCRCDHCEFDRKYAAWKKERKVDDFRGDASGH